MIDRHFICLWSIVFDGCHLGGQDSVYNMGYEGEKSKTLELYINGLILQNGMALANTE